MSSNRENLLKTLRREGFDHVPVDFWLCDSQIDVFREKFGHEDYETWFILSHRRVEMEVKKN